MKRKYTCDDFCKVVDYLLENVPEMSIHTDIICGFPGETTDDWKQTVDLVRKYEFPALHISQFYPRPGTPAAKMKRVNTKEVKRRSREMTEVFSSYETHSKKNGKIYKVLATEIAKDKKHYVAHNKSYDQILVPMRKDLLGQTFEVKIVGTGKFHLFGEVLERTVESGKNPTPLAKGVPSGVNKDWKKPSPKWEEERKKSKRKLRKLTQSDRATFAEEKSGDSGAGGEDHQGPAKSLIIAVIIALIAALYIRITTAQAAADARF
mmetsp:Transcript_457/g.874  ORF Transcript_457/g.874 Transcript_457/m.874 type:complete len:264 (-) Transcript_457:238-1029(-)